MHILEITEADKADYDAFVATNNGSFLQSFEWGEWQTQNGRKAYRFLAKDQKIPRRIVGAPAEASEETKDYVVAAQFIRNPLPLGKYYLYCPYGPVFKCKVTSDECKVAMQELVQTLKAAHPKALFVKFEPQSPTFDTQHLAFSTQHSSRIQPGSSAVLDLTLPEEMLLAQMHKKTRYDIRIALKHNVDVRELTDAATTSQALNLVAQTEERQAYKGHSLAYYTQMAQYFKSATGNSPRLSVYAATYRDLVLASGIFVDFAGTRTYLFGGSSLEHRELMPAYALHWQLIQDAKKAGLTHYDFWGIETSSGTTPGFVRFKLGFGGEQVHYPTPMDISWKPIAYKSYRMAKTLLR